MLSRLEKVKIKRENLMRENPWAIGLAKLAVGLLANRIPDASMGCPVGFMVGIWMMFSVVISPVF